MRKGLYTAYFLFLLVSMMALSCETPDSKSDQNTDDMGDNESNLESPVDSEVPLSEIPREASLLFSKELDSMINTEEQPNFTSILLFDEGWETFNLKIERDEAGRYTAAYLDNYSRMNQLIAQLRTAGTPYCNIGLYYSNKSQAHQSLKFKQDRVLIDYSQFLDEYKKFKSTKYTKTNIFIFGYHNRISGLSCSPVNDADSENGYREMRVGEMILALGKGTKLRNPKKDGFNDLAGRGIDVDTRWLRNIGFTESYWAYREISLYSSGMLVNSAIRVNDLDDEQLELFELDSKGDDSMSCIISGYVKDEFLIASEVDGFARFSITSASMSSNTTSKLPRMSVVATIMPAPENARDLKAAQIRFYCAGSAGKYDAKNLEEALSKSFGELVRFSEKK